MATEGESAIRSGRRHPQQLGSASIKAVMPAITGRGYDGLEIAEGATASLEFMRVHFSEAERQRVRQQLEAYCARETEGMVWIVDELRKLVAGGDSRPLTIRLYSGSASSNAALSRRWPTRAISRPLSTARPSNVELKQPGSDYTRPVLERKSVFHVPGGRLPPSYELFDFARVRLLAVCSQQSLYDLFSFVHILKYTTNRKERLIWHSGQGRGHRRQEAQGVRTAKGFLREAVLGGRGPPVAGAVGLTTL